MKKLFRRASCVDRRVCITLEHTHPSPTHESAVSTHSIGESRSCCVCVCRTSCALARVGNSEKNPKKMIFFEIRKNQFCPRDIDTQTPTCYTKRIETSMVVVFLYVKSKHVQRHKNVACVECVSRWAGETMSKRASARLA